MAQLTITIDGGKITVAQGDDDGDTDMQGAPNADAGQDQQPQQQPVKNLQALLQIVAQFAQSAMQSGQQQASPFDQSMAQRVPGRGAGPGGMQQPGGM